MSGAHHDMSVFQYSDFGQKITHTDRLGNYFVLGDAGYVSMKYNITLKHVTAILIWAMLPRPEPVVVTNAKMHKWS